MLHDSAESGAYICSSYVLLGHHEDEADEDGRAQHADGAHQRVGSFRPLSTEAGGGSSYNHAQQPRHTGDGPEDEAAGKAPSLHLNMKAV